MTGPAGSNAGPSGALPEALLLDLDGTLIDSEAFHCEAVVRCLRRHGLEPDARERRLILEHNWITVHRELGLERRIGLDFGTLQAGAIAEKPALIAEGRGIRVLPGVTAFIERAQALGVGLAIVSGSSRVEIEHALDVMGMTTASRFRCLVGGEDVGAPKPSPEGYLLAARRLGAVPDRCLVVEDNAAGIASALNAGMRVVATRAVLPPPGSPGHQDQSRAHRVVQGVHVLDDAALRHAMRD